MNEGKGLKGLCSREGRERYERRCDESDLTKTKFAGAPVDGPRPWQ